MAADEHGFLDGPGARIVALLVVIACAAVLGYIHRDDLFPAEPVNADAGLNPEFVKCRDARTAQVEKMLNDGVIDQLKFDAFRERAVAFCTAQFPPDEKPQAN